MGLPDLMIDLVGYGPVTTLDMARQMSLMIDGVAWTKAFYNYKPCCDKKSNTVGSLIVWETESPVRAKQYWPTTSLLKTVNILEWIISFFTSFPYLEI